MRSILALLLLAQPAVAQLTIGPERQLTQPDLRPAAFSQQNAAVAADGVGWLVAWGSGLFNDLPDVVAATRIAADGSVLDPSPIIIANGGAGHPAVAFGIDRYLVAWSTADSIRARMVGANGSLSPSVQLAALSSGLGVPPPIVRAAWDGSRFLVAWTYVLDASFSKVRRGFALLDANGTAQTSQTLFEGAAGIDFGLAAGSGEFVLVDTVPDFAGTPAGNGYPSSARAFRIDDAGHVTGPIAILPATTPLFSPRVAFNGRDYLIVASTNKNLPGQSEGARLGIDGSVTPVAPFYSGDSTVNTLTWSGHDYVVTLNDTATVSAMHLDAAAAPNTPLQQLIAGSNAEASDAAWNDQRLLVAIDANSDVFEDFLDSPRPVALSPAHQQYPDVASAGDGDALAVWNEPGSTLVAGAMAVTLHNGLPSAAPARLGDAFGAPVVAWSGSEYLAVWRGPSGVVAMRLDRSGNPLDSQPFVIDPLIPQLGTPAVTFDGENFVVAYETGGGCTHGTTLMPVVRRVSLAGVVLDATPISTGGRTCGTTLSLASGSNGSLLAWSGFEGPHAAFVTRGSTPGAISLAPMSGTQTRALWTGAQFIVADVTPLAVEWFTVSENGFPQAFGSLPDANAASATSSAFTRAGQEALFAWTSGPVFGLRFSLDGFAIGRSFVISSSDGHAANVAAADGVILYQRLVDDPAVRNLARIFVRDIAITPGAPRRHASR